VYLLQRFLVATILLLSLLASPARAESLSINDLPDGIRLDVEDVPVEQALDALSRRFGFAVKIVRPSGVLLSGSRTGTPLEILNWVLTGHNRAIFVSSEDGEKVSRVVVYGPAGSAPPPQQQEQQMHPEEPYEDFPPESSAPEDNIKDPPLDGGVGDYGSEPPPDTPPQ
jgi:hypothetical protein